MQYGMRAHAVHNPDQCSARPDIEKKYLKQKNTKKKIDHPGATGPR